MEFIKGKYYKCRDGRKALFVGRSTHGENCYELIFERFNVLDTWVVTSLDKNGKVYVNPECEHPNDIVSEWSD